VEDDGHGACCQLAVCELSPHCESEVLAAAVAEVGDNCIEYVHENGESSYANA
jgi:hypothetical protein